MRASGVRRYERLFRNETTTDTSWCITNNATVVTQHTRSVTYPHTEKDVCTLEGKSCGKNSCERKARDSGSFTLGYLVNRHRSSDQIDNTSGWVGRRQIKLIGNFLPCLPSPRKQTWVRGSAGLNFDAAVQNDANIGNFPILPLSLRVL